MEKLEKVLKEAKESLPAGELWVYYKGYDRNDDLEKKIVKIVGTKEDGSGVDTNKKIRDMSFSFKSVELAKAAKARLQAALGSKLYQINAFGDVPECDNKE